MTTAGVTVEMATGMAVIDPKHMGIAAASVHRYLKPLGR
jgi:hypothetical protein